MDVKIGVSRTYEYEDIDADDDHDHIVAGVLAQLHTRESMQELERT